jgi:hypothetical protein
MEILIRWLIGLAVSLGIGYVGAATTLWVLNSRIGFDPSTEPRGPGVPAWITGIIERLFFTVAVGLDISGTAIAMIGWITVKMFTDLNRPGKPFSAAATVSLLASLVSMLFALIGGSVIRLMKL